MLGIGGAVLNGGVLPNGKASGYVLAECSSPGGAIVGDVSQSSFSQKFAADSADAGLTRSLVELRRRAERLVAEENWQAALPVFETMATDAVELRDKASEAAAVLGIADCLSKPDEIDVELVCGLYRHAGNAAEEAGDMNTRFLALVRCAAIRRTCRMFDRSEALWEVALDLAMESGNSEHIALARSELAKTLISASGESNLHDIVDESKVSVGYASRPPTANSEVQIHNGPSQNIARATKLLEQVVQELPQTAIAIQQAKARMNYASALKSKHKQSTQNAKAVEREMLLAREMLTGDGDHPQMLKHVENALLELYDENPCLLNGKQEAQELEAKLKDKYSASSKDIYKGTAEESTPSDPEERYAFEKAAWARQKLASMNVEDSDSDSEVLAPARPMGDGWQR